MFRLPIHSQQRRIREQERWQRTKHLGSGSFGVVWLETCTEGSSSGRVRAVKEIVKGTASVTVVYSRELEAIAKFSQEKYRHAFVRSFGWYETSNTIYITMEYLPLGDLDRYLLTRLQNNESRYIIRQLLEGLEFMHDNNFAHRDLKPANILVQHQGPEWWVKIADFGIAKRIEGTELRTVIGTEAYQAPELKGLYTADSHEDDDSTFSLAVDIWSIGVIAFRMTTGQLPFPPGRKLFNYVVNGHPFPLDYTQHMDAACLEFVKITLAASPAQRPNTKVALSYQWIPRQEPDLFPSDETLLDETPVAQPSASTISSLASAQWSTLNEDMSTLRVESTTPIHVAADEAPAVVAGIEEVARKRQEEKAATIVAQRKLQEFKSVNQGRSFDASNSLEVNEKLQKLTRCGFGWKREAGGWRCEGGVYFITDTQFNAL